jgi:hypothetical protein
MQAVSYVHSTTLGGGGGMFNTQKRYINSTYVLAPCVVHLRPICEEKAQATAEAVPELLAVLHEIHSAACGVMYFRNTLYNVPQHRTVKAYSHSVT